MRKLIPGMSAFLVLLIGFPGVGSLLAQESDREMNKARRKAESRYLRKDDANIHRYFDTFEVEPETIVDGHIVVMRGDLEVRGTVNGDLLVLWGDVDVYAGGVVNGDVTSIGGSVTLQDSGEVNGTMLEKRWRSLVRTEYHHAYTYHSHRSDNFYDYDDEHFGRVDVDGTNIGVRYNRVEGVFLSLAVPRYLRNTRGHLNGYGFIGYGFESGDVRYQVGLDRWLFDRHNWRTEIGAELHDLTDTKDLWRIGHTENSLAAFILKEDFHDYFEREGYSFHLSQNLTRHLKATVAWRNDTYRSLGVNTNWSILGGNDNFRENPSLGRDEGEMRSIYTSVVIDSRDSEEHRDGGMMIEVTAENSAPGFGGDFDFNRYTAEVRLYERMMYDEGLMLRLLAGTSDGALPFQKNFEIGGISTLRGFSYKEFSGTRMVLANVEYKLNSRIFGDLLGIDDLHFIMFGDVGNAWSGSGDEGIVDSFKPLTWRNLKSNLGVALSDASGRYRVNFAKRTDRSYDDKVITFRIAYPF